MPQLLLSYRQACVYHGYLSNGKQSHNVADGEIDLAEFVPGRKRDQDSNCAAKENLDPKSSDSEDARVGIDGSTTGVHRGPHDLTPNVKLNAPVNKKRRRTSDQLSDEDDTTTTKQERDRHESEDHDSSDERQNAEQKPLERTRKALEIQWDRSQLRDPRLTPERVILPRRSEFDLTEEEKQFFRGSPPKRPKKNGRLNAADEDNMFREEAKKNVAHCFHELYICYEKGPQGSLTYDNGGFQLDFRKVADWMKPKAYNKRAMVNGMEKRLERDSDERGKMAAAFFQGGTAPDKDDGRYAFDLLKDKVSKDLGVAWHKITAAHVEEWASMGFPKENPRDYVRATVTKEEQRRFLSLLKGGSLRK